MVRRFPAPWKVVEHTESFHVEDAHGQVLAHFYFEDADAAFDLAPAPEG